MRSRPNSYSLWFVAASLLDLQPNRKHAGYEVFACTLPAQPRQTWRPQPSHQIQTACRAQMAWPGPTRLVSYRKRWATISSHFSVAVKRKAWKLAAHWWGVTLRVIGSFASMSLSGAVVKRRANAECHFYLSTTCIKMIIFNWLAVSHHFNQFRLQSWSFLCSGFIQDTRETHLICRICLSEHFIIFTYLNPKFHRY